MGLSLLFIAVVIALLGDSQAFFLLHIPHRSRHSTSKQPRTTSYDTWRSNGRISEITAAAAAVRGSTVELVEPETGCHVILLGCFHGSQSSAEDVTSCITNDTNVVCMELCASRFEDLRRDLLQDQQEEANKKAAAQSSGGTRLPVSKRKMWIFRFTEMVKRKVQSRGLSTGVAAALLGGVSGMQTALSGLEPGLEFRRALEQVQSISISSINTRSCDIVLADQNVDETLQKVGQLPSLAMDMWKDCLQHGWASSCGIEASALKTALAGSTRNSNNKNNNKLQQLTIWNFLTRNQAAIRDLGRLVLPPVLLLNALAWTTHDSILFFDWSVVVTTAAADAASTAEGFAPMAQDAFLMTIASVAANWLFLFFLYVSVALPVARVVLRERDDTLTSGIRQACHLALQQQQQRSNNEMESSAPPIRVVAVLGYLHVNGVAERLLLKQQNDAPDQVVATSPEI